MDGKIHTPDGIRSLTTGNLVAHLCAANLTDQFWTMRLCANILANGEPRSNRNLTHVLTHGERVKSAP